MIHNSNSNLDIKFGAASMLVHGATELMNIHGVDDVIKVLGISRQAALSIRDMSTYDMPDLCSRIEGRKAAQLVIDYQKTTQIAKILSSINETQTIILRESTESYMRSLSSGESAYKQVVVSRFLDYISGMMLSVEHAPGQRGLDGIPPELFSAFQDLRTGVLPLFSRLLIKQGVLSVKVDKVAVDTVIAGCKAHVRGRKLLHDLIKAGAHLTFIERYNQERYIDVQYYRQWREFHSIGRKREKISPSLGVDIYSLFNRLMSANMAVIDVYFELHRKFKMRIETLYTYIQKCIEEESLEEDDDDDCLYDELIDLINE